MEKVVKTVKKTGGALKTVFLRDWTPAEKALLLLNTLLFGILVGRLTSPIKKWVISADCDLDKEEED